MIYMLLMHSIIKVVVQLLCFQNLQGEDQPDGHEDKSLEIVISVLNEW